MDVETYTAPPEPDEDEDGDDASIRVAASILGGGVYHASDTQIFNLDAQGPDDLADAMLNVMLGLAQQHSSDLSWALQERLIRYDGQRSWIT